VARADGTDADNHVRQRNGRGRFVPSLDTAARDAAAARMRERGVPYDTIVDELKFDSAGSAANAVRRALRATRTEDTEDAKALALRRLDFMYSAALAVLEARHYTVSDGCLVYLGGKVLRDEDGNIVKDARGRAMYDDHVEPLLDDGPVLQALDRLVRIEARRAAIEGYDAPAKSRIEVTRTDGIDAAVRDLVAQLGRRAEVPRP
jgi:hypothetical protein